MVEFIVVNINVQLISVLFGTQSYIAHIRSTIRPVFIANKTQKFFKKRSVYK